ncbi:helix-hairpin-helix domain-containing protein [Aquimarina aquimarini]|uniref:helix-hairpin-helix domain-containing protein n=1 Tax=Aquimarina aquimarini TaxID=1191734 RepID=UPI00131EE830|nr:helix-hairpin-helix domain-containing protein [Aquimarina aquimarini]
MSGYFFYTMMFNAKHDFTELGVYRLQVESLRGKAVQQKKEYQVYPFNPNFISDYKGYALGLTTIEIDRLHAYRNKNKWINSISDFKKVTLIPDSTLVAIAPLFKFPKKKINNKFKKNTKKKYKSLSYRQKKDLNNVSVEELIEDIKLPDFVAIKIIRYRDKLGGFIDDMQLQDVKVYTSQKHKILSMYTVKTPQNIKKININKASIKELVAVPYFDFEMALDIRDFIEKKGEISNFEELGEIKGFSLEKINRIELYLTLN